MLRNFVEDLQVTFNDDFGISGRQEALKLLQGALKKSELITECFPEFVTEERRVVFEDPKLGFCVCAHVFGNKKSGKPHDHGPTWAIYGQVAGQTEMSDWRAVQSEKNNDLKIVEIVRNYTLNPGDAHLYNVGDVHAASSSSRSLVLRIEGQNTEYIQRTPMRQR